jgi:glutamyl-tRNA reductase
MGKATEKKGVSIMDVNEENFSESLKSVNKFGDDIVKMAQENKEKEDKERQAKEYARIADKASYTNLRMVADSKYAKKTADIYKSARDASKALLERVTKGELTASDYEDELEKIVDEHIKKVEAQGKELRKDRTELRNAFPNSYCYGWDNPWNRLNRAIENNKN